MVAYAMCARKGAFARPVLGRCWIETSPNLTTREPPPKVATCLELVVASRSKAATMRHCVDEQECEEYQLRQKEGRLADDHG
jgi:hypothetical protein